MINEVKMNDILSDEKEKDICNVKKAIFGILNEKFPNKSDANYVDFILCILIASQMRALELNEKQIKQYLNVLCASAKMLFKEGEWNA